MDDETVSSLSDDGKISSSSSHRLRALAWAGAGAAAAFNVAILLSLVPVVRGRGAPFLPSHTSNIDGMFAWLRRQPEIQAMLLRQQLPNSLGGLCASASAPASKLQHRQQIRCRRLTFVDLGSGDGRWVFRAARKHSDLFEMSVGYEINPLLHAWASLRRLTIGLLWDPNVLAATSLRCQDLWSVSLHDANVVAVVRSFLCPMTHTPHSFRCAP
jgi:hypothetical protein